MTKPLLLDLFCGAGGAAMGYHRAGFDVVGVDIKPQPHYPFTFVQADALDALEGELGDVDRFDFIHASPPCQRYMTGGLVNRRAHPDLLGLVRSRLIDAQVPWVIENVPAAPMRQDLLFGLPLRRHRLFEFETERPMPDLTMSCHHSGPIVGVYGNPHGQAGAWPGMLPGSLDSWRAAMEIDWMTAKEISQAIPPAYTAYVGWKLRRCVSASG